MLPGNTGGRGSGPLSDRKPVQRDRMVAVAGRRTPAPAIKPSIPPGRGGSGHGFAGKELKGKEGIRMSASRKTAIALFLLISLLLHISLVEGIYLLSGPKKEQPNRKKPELVAVKITPPARQNRPVKRALPEPEKKPPGEKNSVKRPRVKKSRIKGLSPARLAAIGQRHLAMLKRGTFPPLTLSYRSPAAYIREMYRLGAKTVVYDREHGGYYQTDLFTGKILPMSESDFEGFSFIKRVIKDPEWQEQKRRASSRLETNPDSASILLLLPLSVETRWIGHQVSAFRQMNLSLSSIARVDARFEDASLRIVRIHLTDGSSLSVDDPGCA